MSRGRITAMVRRIVQEVRRDRPSIGLLFIAPILLTGLVAFIVREADAAPVNAAILEPSGPLGASVSEAFTSALVADGGSVTVVADEAAARDAVDTGTVSLAVLLPSGPPTDGGVTITVITNGLDPGGEAAQIAAVQRALLSVAGTLTGATLPTVEHETIHGVPNADPITRYAPAIVGFFAYFFVYMLTGVSFLRERTGGTLERLMATPVARGEIVVGYTLGFAIFATIQVIVLLLWTLGSVQVPQIGPLPEFSVGLGVPMAGSPALAFLVVLLVAIGAVSLGIFLSTFARTELQVIQFIPLVIAPQFLLSGILFPVSSLPAILQPLSAIMPITYAVDGLRQVFIAGADLSVPELQADLLILAGFAVVFGVVATATIRRDVV